MTENHDGPIDEHIELSDQDEADLERLYNGDALPGDEAEAPYFPLLIVWREVLAPALAESTKKVTPQWANRMIAKYAGLTFAEMNEVRDRYFAKIEQIRQILLAEIATDDECASPADIAEDLEQNGGHYKALLFEWQLAFLDWELAWTCTDEHAAAELAAIGEVYNLVFGGDQPGLTAHLDSIKYVFTDADQAELRSLLEERRAEVEEGQ